MLEPELGGVGPPSGGEEHEIGVAQAAIGEFNLDVLLFSNGGRLAAEADGQALGAHFVGDPRADLDVEAAQQPLAAVGERGLDPEAVEDVEANSSAM